jgi:hypothetical protein
MGAQVPTSSSLTIITIISQTISLSLSLSLSLSVRTADREVTGAEPLAARCSVRKGGAAGDEEEEEDLFE